MTDGKANNENIKLYTDAMAEAAEGTTGVVFVDLFTPTQGARRRRTAKHLTINGIHLNDVRRREGRPRCSTRPSSAPGPKSVKADLAKLKAEVNEKNLQFWYDYRAINGCYIYGGRKAPFGIVNFPAEFAKLRKMVAEARAARLGRRPGARTSPTTIDDSDTGELARVETNVKGPIHAHLARGGAEDLQAPRRLRGQPVRLRGRVPRPQEARADDLRRQGAALGHDHAVVPDVPARPAGRTTRS